jgi:hypothetical protein
VLRRIFHECFIPFAYAAFDCCSSGDSNSAKCRILTSVPTVPTVLTGCVTA